jgi:PGF-CTERM protein
VYPTAGASSLVSHAILDKYGASLINIPSLVGSIPTVVVVLPLDTMPQKYKVIAGVALLLVVGVIGIGASPIASAEHGTEANYTAQPVEAPADRMPGASGASYKQFAVANDSIEKIDFFVVTWQAGDLGGCGASNTEEFGIDRGGDNSGTGTDEGLLQYVKNQQRSEDRVVAEFYDDDDVGGETTYINESDEIISYQTDCFGNPDEPGWYQITAMVNGTGWDGEYKEVSVSSHYFWICDCESESEARDKLGPPPSEEDGTADADSSPTPTDAGGGATTATPTDTADGESTPTATATDGGDGTETRATTDEADSTPRETPTADERTTGEQTSGDEDDGQAGADNSTPTSGGGPGFTGIGAVLALLTTALLIHRRR